MFLAESAKGYEAADDLLWARVKEGVGGDLVISAHNYCYLEARGHREAYKLICEYLGMGVMNDGVGGEDKVVSVREGLGGV